MKQPNIPGKVFLIIQLKQPFFVLLFRGGLYIISIFNINLRFWTLEIRVFGSCSSYNFMASSESTQRYVIISCDMCIHPFGLVGLDETTVCIYIYTHMLHPIASNCIASPCTLHAILLFFSISFHELQNMCIYKYTNISINIYVLHARNLLKTRMFIHRHKMPVTPAGFPPEFP